MITGFYGEARVSDEGAYLGCGSLGLDRLPRDASLALHDPPPLGLVEAPDLGQHRCLCELRKGRRRLSNTRSPWQSSRCGQSDSSPLTDRVRRLHRK